jgi:AcrR family transcriptional regulator
LYWHVKSKAELLDALADAIMDEAIAAIPAPTPDGDGREWLLAALGQLRAAMLRHRDGARIVSGARYSMRRGDFSEQAMATLVDRGVDLHRARLLVLAGERYTVGWVLEEQTPAPTSTCPTRRGVGLPLPDGDSVGQVRHRGAGSAGPGRLPLTGPRRRQDVPMSFAAGAQNHLRGADRG